MAFEKVAPRLMWWPMVHFCDIMKKAERLDLQRFQPLPISKIVPRAFGLWYTFVREGKNLRVYPTHTLYDQFLPSDPCKPYQLPRQKRELLKVYWPVRHAARKWGCSYRAARLYILRHPEIGVLVRVQHQTAPKPRWIIAARADAAKIPAMRGNPDMLDPHWQRRYALDRWMRRKAEKSEG